MDKNKKKNLASILVGKAIRSHNTNFPINKLKDSLIDMIPLFSFSDSSGNTIAYSNGKINERIEANNGTDIRIYEEFQGMSYDTLVLADYIRLSRMLDLEDAFKEILFEEIKVTTENIRRYGFEKFMSISLKKAIENTPGALEELIKDFAELLDPTLFVLKMTEPTDFYCGRNDNIYSVLPFSLEVSLEKLEGVTKEEREKLILGTHAFYNGCLRNYISCYSPRPDGFWGYCPKSLKINIGVTSFFIPIFTTDQDLKEIKY